MTVFNRAPAASDEKRLTDDASNDFEIDRSAALTLPGERRPLAAPTLLEKPRLKSLMAVEPCSVLSLLVCQVELAVADPGPWSLMSGLPLLSVICTACGEESKSVIVVGKTICG